jgi:hypothetical protein
MVDEARPSRAEAGRRAQFEPDRAGGGADGQVLMGSAIGVAAALVFAVFLWMAVH